MDGNGKEEINKNGDGMGRGRRGKEGMDNLMGQANSSQPKRRRQYSKNAHTTMVGWCAAAAAAWKRTCALALCPCPWLCPWGSLLVAVVVLLSAWLEDTSEMSSKARRPLFASSSLPSFPPHRPKPPQFSSLFPRSAPSAGVQCPSNPSIHFNTKSNQKWKERILPPPLLNACCRCLEGT